MYFLSAELVNLLIKDIKKQRSKGAKKRGRKEAKKK
jgi:hypothetical protein